MPSFFGKLLGGLGIGKNARPSFGSSPLGILAPARSVGILETSADQTILGSEIPNKSVSFGDVIGNAGKIIGIVGDVASVLTNSTTPAIDSGALPEVTVTTDKPNVIQQIGNAATNLAQGKPIVTMGQEFSLGDNLKIPIYLGLGLLAYKLLKGGR